MTIVHEFDYHKPSTLQEALELLGRYGGKASVLAGGTDIVSWLRDEMVEPEALVDLKGINGLDQITTDEKSIHLGSLVTLNDLICSDAINEKLPLLVEAAHVFASTAVRNRATIAGNICSAVPSCDSGPALLVYEAIICVTGKNGDREISIVDWFLAPRKTSLAMDEIVTGIKIPLPLGACGGCYAKLGRYEGEDLAQAGVAVLALADNQYRVAFGAVAPKPLRGYKIESLLNGNDATDAVLDEAVKLLSEETSPIADIRAEKEYRVHMLEIMLKRAVKTAVSRMETGKPAYGTKVI
jgi:CO/xanthine dehydrogenase FAD-binding subunit